MLGHLVNHFLICRPVLSILDDFYRFSGESLEYARFSPAVFAELKVASVLVLLCEVSMALSAWPTVYVLQRRVDPRLRAARVVRH